ncbi:extracellular solute-binding protein [Actinospica durhamensis]|uniref:Extracellular solute-binding protein n=1 Tax=Actinospica durhamensis TaxID=1508375 RepID=A0A941ISV8_9ACTN|nr:extracellular solute-binding protein [Actinospica durhamensis]MBR7838979.1 extracellular solute-binding protein [Actinospica durhamensis]
MSRRQVLAALAGGAAVMATTAGCGFKSAGASSSSPDGDVSYWTQVDPTNTVQQAAISAFNKTAKGQVTLSEIASTGYLSKIQTAMGSSAMPGLFFNWGGGSLSEYVKAGKLVELDASLKSHFLASPLQAGIVDGKFVGLPCRGTQPVFLYYNKSLFAQAGVQPPATYDDLLNLVQVFKKRGVIPFAIAGTSANSWTELMWIEYLVDRLAGPDLFKSIAGGDWSGWKDPSILQAAQMVEELVAAGAFGTTFGSVNYGAGGTSTLFATGRAAMQLMGSWDYATLQGISADFTANDLGYVAFPAIGGGKGDPKNVSGNPTNYLTMTTAAARTTATDFLQTVFSDSYVLGLVKMGEVPVTTNTKSLLSQSSDPAYSNFLYDLVADAPSFTQSWDQALGSTLATPMLTEIQKLFNGQDSPAQFVSNVLAIQS